MISNTPLVLRISSNNISYLPFIDSIELDPIVLLPTVYGRFYLNLIYLKSLQFWIHELPLVHLAAGSENIAQNSLCSSKLKQVSFYRSILNSYLMC
jgi:hypothetical protein